MILSNDLFELNISEDTAVTIGKFDGLHRGHQKLLDALHEAGKKGLKTAVLSFDNGKPGILSFDEMTRLLSAFQVDYLIRVPLNEKVMQMEADTFIRDILMNNLSVKEIICGSDFCFGHARQGNVAFLEENKGKYGYDLQVIDKEMLGNQEISSTLIRKLLKDGQMELVSEALGRDYTVSGEIVHGKALGRKLGFPTINVYPEEDQLLPAFGVYFSLVEIEGVTYGGLLNIGTKPTVSEEMRSIVEVNLFDFSGDLYGKHAVVRFISFIRPEQKFSGIDELQVRVNQDIAEAKARFNAVKEQ